MNFAEFISPVTVVTGVTGVTDAITIVIELLIKALLYSNPLIQFTRKYIIYLSQPSHLSHMPVRTACLRGSNGHRR